ncbi:hypothetical protein [Alloactinosynnema sp. L-07]|uniref:hypothetical protein n=1 Tax=Alloactinosynnema sp. L-07 TaxID=1653480 RepID=UPI00065EFC9B|nr:hypothetical protein [Alloactinosynnema sp. L-07]CRK59034.1 hypothetical protein [Alloactinosynnema sp. L-07]
MAEIRQVMRGPRGSIALQMRDPDWFTVVYQADENVKYHKDYERAYLIERGWEVLPDPAADAPAVTRKDLAAALRAAGYVDPDDDTVPRWPNRNDFRVWVPVTSLAEAILAHYDIRPKTPSTTCAADCGHVGCLGGCGVEHPPTVTGLADINAAVLGDRRGELHRPGGERP